MPLQYNPTDSRFLTVAQSRTNNGQKDIRIILDLPTNDFYSLDDDGNFNVIGASGGTTIDYTEYVAFVTQSGATAPTAVVVDKNDTGFVFTYGYTSTGSYTIIATGAFPDKNKVIPYFNSQVNQGFTTIGWSDADTLYVATTDTSAVLTNGQFEGNLVIKIYN
jgi:hypothetical protein